MIHSDNGFAAVSYLRIKGAILEEKPESGIDLTVPPLLEGNFARIQTLLRGHPSTDNSIHAVSKLVTWQPTVHSCGSSTSRKGSWVTIGNVYRATGQEITFEEEVAQCFCDLQGSSKFFGEMLF